MESRANQIRASSQAQLQGLFGTLLLLFGLATYAALRNAAAYAARDGNPMSLWQVYLVPALFLLGSLLHYGMAIRISRGGAVSLLSRLAPISIAGAFVIYRLL